MFGIDLQRSVAAALTAVAFAAGAIEVMGQEPRSAPPDIQSLRNDVPVPLADVIARSLRKKPDERWQTADEMRQALLPYSLAAG